MENPCFLFPFASLNIALKRHTFVKEAAQINMNCIPTSRIQKNVLSMAVAKTYDESDH